MLRRIATALWGKFESRDEVIKFSLLGLIFGLIIGAYWALRPVKDSVFASIVGIDYQPYAKVLSLFVIVPLIILYGKLLDMLPRHKVFYLLTALYGIAALIFGWFLSHPLYGIPNTIEDPTRVIGWMWYVFVESFGSLIVALFWAFTADITSDKAARRGFPLIALFGQFGNILGPLVLRARYWGFAHSGPIVLIVGPLMFCIGLLMWVFMRVIPKEQLVGYQAKPAEGVVAKEKEEPGFFEGLKLLLTQPYLLGIFLVTGIYETIVTIFDFHMKSMVSATYPLELARADYLTTYAVTTGIVSFLSVLFGINNIQRRLGMKASLLAMPLLVAAAVVVLKMYPALSVTFWIMVIAKAINYALNQPTLKQLYIPTTRDTQYKAQAWIEMFGSRGSKATGSTINMLRGTLKTKYGAAAGMTMFLTMSAGLSFGLIGAWFLVVMFVAKTYNKAIKEERVVC